MVRREVDRTEILRDLNTQYRVGFEVLTAAIMKMAVFWFVTLFVD
jgi:hypothetical protein